MNKRNRYTVMLAVSFAVATLAVATWAMHGDKLEEITEVSWRKKASAGMSTWHGSVPKISHVPFALNYLKDNLD